MFCFPNVWAPAALSYFTAVASLALCLLIIAGNSLIILAVVLDPLRKLRTPFSYFLVNLAVSDMFVGLLTMPASVDIHLHEAQGYYESYKVTLIHVSYFVSSTASVLSLAALCLDRFVAIKWPIMYRKSLSLPRCLLISLTIWVFASTVSMVYLKVGYVDYLMVFAHISIIVTFGILIFTYLQVYRVLRSQSRRFRSPPEGGAIELGGAGIERHGGREISVQKNVTRAFLYILALFISSYAPAIVMIYVLQFCTGCNCTVRHVMRDLQFVLVAANSAMNPFVCGIRLGAFRKSIIHIICCRRKAPEDAGLIHHIGTRFRSDTVTSSAATITGSHEVQEVYGDQVNHEVQKVHEVQEVYGDQVNHRMTENQRTRGTQEAHGACAQLHF